jgi:hypothetical protein
MTIQDIVKKKFMPVVNNEHDAESIANALLDPITDIMLNDCEDGDDEERVTIALTQVLLNRLVD